MREDYFSVKYVPLNLTKCKNTKKNLYADYFAQKK